MLICIHLHSWVADMYVCVQYELRLGVSVGTELGCVHRDVFWCAVGRLVIAYLCCAPVTELGAFGCCCELINYGQV